MVNMKIFILFFSSLIISGCAWFDDENNYCLNNMKFCFDIKSKWINNKLMNSEKSSGLVNRDKNNYMDLVFLGEFDLKNSIVITDFNKCKRYNWGLVCDMAGILGFHNDEFLQNFKNYKIIEGRNVLIYCDDYSCLNEIKRLR